MRKVFPSYNKLFFFCLELNPVPFVFMFTVLDGPEQVLHWFSSWKESLFLNFFKELSKQNDCIILCTLFFQEKPFHDSMTFFVIKILLVIKLDHFVRVQNSGVNMDCLQLNRFEISFFLSFALLWLLWAWATDSCRIRAESFVEEYIKLKKF